MPSTNFRFVVFLIIGTYLSIFSEILKGQNTFIINFNTPHCDFINAGIENHDHDFLFVGNREYRQVGGWQLDSGKAMIQKVTAIGDTMTFLYEKTDTICKFLGIHQNSDNSYDLTGTLSELVQNPYTSNFLFFWYIHLYPNFSIGFEKKYLIPSDYKFLEDSKTINLPNNTFLFAATAKSNAPHRDDIILINYNLNGDLQKNFVFLNDSTWSNFLLDLTVNYYDSLTYVIGSNFLSNSTNQLLKLDSEFGVVQLKEVTIIEEPLSFHFISPERFLMVGLLTNWQTSDEQITARKQSLSAIEDSIIIGYSDSLEYPGFISSFTKTSDENYLITGTVSESILGNQHTTVTLTKIDSSLTKIWQRYYPVYLHDFFVNGVFNCTDGGFIVYGLTTSYPIFYQRSTVILKFNQDGLLNGIEEPNLLSNSVSVYPSPFIDEIWIKLTNPQKKCFQLYNSYNQLIFSTIIESQATINLSFLSDGIYFYRFFEEGKKPLSNKIIKVSK